MDEFGQIGPEKGHYPGDVRAVARTLGCRRTAYVALAAKHSRMDLVLTLKTSMEYARTPGGLPEPGVWLYVAVTSRGAYWFDIGQHLHPSYIADKVNVEVPDAETLGEFFARLRAEIVPIDAERRGLTLA